jgi:hypothetical protein
VDAAVTVTVADAGMKFGGGVCCTSWLFTAVDAAMNMGGDGKTVLPGVVASLLVPEAVTTSDNGPMQGSASCCCAGTLCSESSLQLLVP